MKNQLVICVENTGYEVSLETRKLYETIPDANAEKLNQIRVIDESGEDYLYPSDMFISVDFPSGIEKAVLNTA